MHKNRAENFAGQKRAKTAKRTRKSQKKAKPGAFWVLEGMGTVENRGERMGKPSNRAEGLVSPAGSVRPGRSPLGCRPPRHAVLEWMWENTSESGKRPMSPGSHRKPTKGRCWFGAAKFFGRPKRRSNRLFEGVLHHGAGLVQLAGVQVDAGGWVAVPAQIPGNCVVEDCQSFPKDGVVPQGGEHAAFFQQGRGVVGADAPSLS